MVASHCYKYVRKNIIIILKLWWHNTICCDNSRWKIPKEECYWLNSKLAFLRVRYYVGPWHYLAGSCLFAGQGVSGTLRLNFLLEGRRWVSSGPQMSVISTRRKQLERWIDSRAQKLTTYMNFFYSYTEAPTCTLWKKESFLFPTEQYSAQMKIFQAQDFNLQYAYDTFIASVIRLTVQRS